MGYRVRRRGFSVETPKSPVTAEGADRKNGEWGLERWFNG